MLTVTVLGPLVANEEAWIAAVSEPGEKLDSKVLDTSEQAIAWLLNKLPAGKITDTDIFADLFLMLVEQSPELVEAGKLAEAITEQRILERS